MIYIAHNSSWSAHIKNDDVWWGMWGRGKAPIGFWWGNLRERTHMEGLAVDGRIILKWSLKTLNGGGRNGLD